MADITITHTHEHGTILDGSARGDGVYEIARQSGFTFSRNVGIYIKGSRDQLARRHRIDPCARALRAAGHEVTVTIDDAPRDKATVLDDQAARLDDRHERLTKRAARHQGAADAAYDRADAIAGRFEGGQPIIMGHHSTRRALRDRDKMHQAMQRSVAEQNEAERLAGAASRVGLDAARSERPDVTARRIKKNESELRVIERDMAGHTRRHLDGRGRLVMVDPHPPATGAHLERLLARKAVVERDLEWDRARLEVAKAAGFVVHGRDNVHVDDRVTWGLGWYKVTKVNRTTCRVEDDDRRSGFNLEFVQIRQVMCTHEGTVTAPPPPTRAPRTAKKSAQPEHTCEATRWQSNQSGITVLCADDHVVTRIRAEDWAGSQWEAKLGALSAARAAVRTPERDAAIAKAIAAPAVCAVGYFPTPAALAEQILRDYTDLAEGRAVSVLEPSAGHGALVRAVHAINPAAHVVAVEPNANLARLIGEDEHGRLTVFRRTFEDLPRPDRPAFDLVVMNPPFSAPGRPMIWAEHVMTAYEMLAPGGRLVAIVPASIEYGQQKKPAQLRELVNELGGDFKRLPARSFATSGTTIDTFVLWLDRPASAKAETPAPAVAADDRLVPLFDLAEVA